MDEKIMNITLRKTKNAPRTKRANRAIKEIRANVVRHMKTTEENVWIDHRLNEAIWARGIQKPPSRIRVKAVKFEDGLVEVSLPEDSIIEE
ncbi:MAG: 50S ribosomal protein L31e [Euryarchaeota archaeon]|nr:50S ribosomal protein L31e [Euryarchaeota archaeon]